MGTTGERLCRRFPGQRNRLLRCAGHEPAAAHVDSAPRPDAKKLIDTELERVIQDRGIERGDLGRRDDARVDCEHPSAVELTARVGIEGLDAPDRTGILRVDAHRRAIEEEDRPVNLATAHQHCVIGLGRGDSGFIHIARRHRRHANRLGGRKVSRVHRTGFKRDGGAHRNLLWDAPQQLVDARSRVRRSGDQTPRSPGLRQLDRTTETQDGATELHVHDGAGHDMPVAIEGGVCGTDAEQERRVSGR